VTEGWEQNPGCSTPTQPPSPKTCEDCLKQTNVITHSFIQLFVKAKRHTRKYVPIMRMKSADSEEKHCSVEEGL
jgi:hypothetical protein